MKIFNDSMTIDGKSSFPVRISIIKHPVYFLQGIPIEYTLASPKRVRKKKSRNSESEAGTLHAANKFADTAEVICERIEYSVQYK